MARRSPRLKAAQCGTAPIHPRPPPALDPSRSTQTSLLALFPLTIQMEPSGPTMCCLRATSRLQSPSRRPGPTAWTHRTQAATPTSTTLTRTSTPVTTTPCSIHIPLIAPQRWILGSVLCCCPLSGTKASRLPAQEVLHTARGWSQRWTQATSPLPPFPGAHHPSTDLWRCTTQVDSAKQLCEHINLQGPVTPLVCFNRTEILTLSSSFVSFLQLLRPKQRHQCGSKWCSGDDEGISHQKRTILLALSMYSCNTSTLMYIGDGRLADTETMTFCTVHTTSWIWI